MADVLEQLRAALGDRYEVDRLVGEGGMATVYLATDLRHGRKVAIKTLRAELAASIGADRFLREIRVAANLQHPNVLGLYDSGEANGILFYVMPFIEGESLRARLNREQQLPLHDAVRITREAAEALAYAHEHGVVHRDIKPENILLQNGHALVADFGIARAVDAAGEKLTQTGMAVGTPHYMSPEQSLGADHADGRSDIYSLGCVLYELLAGQPPFDGPNSRAILARHAMEQVPSIRIVRQSVPEELEDAVLQALEKTPADRFQKMSELAELLADLEPTLATRRTASRGVPAVRRSTSTERSTAVQAHAHPVAILGEKWGTGVRLWSISAALLAVVTVGRPRRVAAPERLRGAAPRKMSAAEQEPSRRAVLREGARGLGLAWLSRRRPDRGTHPRARRRVRGFRSSPATACDPIRTGNAPLQKIAQELKVGTVVQGGIAQSGDRLRVNVSLVDAGSGVEIGSKTLERPRAEIFALQDDLAQEVVGLPEAAAGPGHRAAARPRSGPRAPRPGSCVQRAEQITNEVDPLLAAADTAAAARRLTAADSLLAQAEARGCRSGSAPIVKRGWLAYRQLDLIGSFDKTYYGKWLDAGMGHAARALGAEPQGS